MIYKKKFDGISNLELSNFSNPFPKSKISFDNDKKTEKMRKNHNFQN